jgi:NADPH:quinone reductase-like Zn-dependent oxidoreductase
MSSEEKRVGRRVTLYPGIVCKAFACLLEWCAQGRLRPLIGVRDGLDQMHAALAHLQSGEHFGKIAIDIP